MTQERWNTFTRQQQIGHISSEIIRANNFKDDEKLAKSCVEKALFLVSLSLGDKQWKHKYRYLFLLYEELAKLYIKENNNYIQLLHAL